MRTTTTPPGATATASSILPRAAATRPHVGMLLAPHPRAELKSPALPVPSVSIAKMSNSDRAKFYRRQYKERTRVLAQSVAALRREVQQLALHTQVLRGLVRCGVQTPARDRIQAFMDAFLAAPRVRLPGFTIDSTVVTRVSVYGGAEAPVVLTRLVLTGTYPPAGLEVVYCSIPGNSVLLDTLLHSRVRYACVVRFAFARDGTCEARGAEVEVDWVAGLLGCVGSAADVAKVAGPIQRLGAPHVDAPDSSRLFMSGIPVVCVDQ